MFSELLRGVRVIDLTQNVAGPFCTQILGDFGADVIKIERPGVGDDTRGWTPRVAGESAAFLAYNRNKRSACVDFASADGARLVAELAKGADVFIHSLKPGSAEQRGLGFDALRLANPRLVYCAISAFGETGPLAQLPGYDPLMQAFTGIMSVMGNEGDDPVRVSLPIIDMGTGMWSALGIFAALMSREKTGEGALVNASLLESGMSWMTIVVAGYLACGKLPLKMGSAMAMTAPYELFHASDGLVFIAAGNDRLYRKVCEALAAPELADDPRFLTNAHRVENRPALREAIESRTRARTSADLVAAMRKAGTPCSEMNDIGQAVRSEQVSAMGMVAPLPTALIPGLKVVPLPLRMDGQRVGQLTPPPLLGADTEAVLGEIGCSNEHLADLRRRGIVG